MGVSTQVQVLCGVQKKASDPLELGLQAVESATKDTGKLTDPQGQYKLFQPRVVGFLETRLYYAAQAGLELILILLPPC